MRWGFVPFWAKDHESRFHEYQRQSRRDRGQARLPRSVPAAALPGAGLVATGCPDPQGMKLALLCCRASSAPRSAVVQAREAASRHDGLN
jgi:hypothetical protein